MFQLFAKSHLTRPAAIEAVRKALTAAGAREVEEHPYTGHAVVIDESHNLSNAATLNNRLARLLARNAEALILASATPHNGRADSFAELLRLLDPSAVPAG